jgi:peptidoglycan hydrolase CwlO-like protein
VLRTALTLTAVVAVGVALGAAGWHALTRMEALMANQNEQLTALRDSLTDFFSDVTAKLDQLNTQQGQFTPEAQATFDEIKGLVAAKDAEIGDADGSDTPAPGV